MLKERGLFVLISLDTFLRTGCLEKSDLPTSCGTSTFFEKNNLPLEKYFFFLTPII